jgi:hypothetical protein
MVLSRIGGIIMRDEMGTFRVDGEIENAAHPGEGKPT